MERGLQFVVGTLHWNREAPARLLRSVVLGGIVAELSVVVGRRIAFYEAEWPVIDLLETIVDWDPESSLFEALRLDTIEGPNEGAPLARRLAPDRWHFTFPDRDNPPFDVRHDELVSAVTTLASQVEAGFKELTGISFSDWESAWVRS